MKIKLTKIKLKNFKGIRSFESVMSDNTDIIGKNGTGKSSIFDAFMWVLFGTDQHGSSAFQIKTHDGTGITIHGLEHSVRIDLEVDGVKVSFERMLKEKWVKPRGRSEKVFSGHKTEYIHDDIPVTKSKYEEAVGNIVKLETFKLITDPLEFNNLHWKDRREIILGLVDIDESKINEKFQDVIEELGGKPIEDVKIKIGAQKKRIKSNLVDIPARISENENAKPEVENWTLINSEIKKFEKELSSIEKEERDVSERMKADYKRKRDLESKVYEIEDSIADRKREISNKIKSERTDLSSIKRELSIKEKELSSYLNHTGSLKKQMNELRSRFKEVNSQPMPDFDDECPTCSQKLPDKDFEEFESNFNIEKSNKLENINKEGVNLKGKIRALDKDIENIKNEIAAIKEELSNQEDKPDVNEIIVSALLNDKNLQNLENKKQESQRLVDDFKFTPDDKGFSEEKNEISERLFELKTKLNKKDEISKFNKRISELKSEERELNNELAKLEKVEHRMYEYSKAKIELIENEINSMFNGVSFRMFEEQVNGGEKETCITLVNGTDWDSANTGHKALAGLEIIRVLSNHYNIKAPVFIDNAESITEPIESDYQLIKLIASTKYKDTDFEDELMIETINN